MPKTGSKCEKTKNIRAHTLGDSKKTSTFALENLTRCSNSTAKGRRARWSLRLSVRTRDFHSLKRGSIPLGTTTNTRQRVSLQRSHASAAEMTARQMRAVRIKGEKFSGPSHSTLVFLFYSLYTHALHTRATSRTVGAQRRDDAHFPPC